MSFGSVKLNDDNELPLIAFGTGSALFGRNATDSVEQALESGFDHIDTAAIYGNESSVGVAIKESGLKREEFFLTTKYDGGDIQESVRDSLEKLGVEYADLYLIHFPQLVAHDFENTWKEFEKIKDDGLAKSIGVSNFSLSDTQALLKTARIKPSVNQIKLNPYTFAEYAPLIAYSAMHGIQIAAYSSLASISRTPGGPVDKPVADAAKRLGATPAQVLLAWARAKGAAIVTTSGRKERLQEYLDAAAFVGKLSVVEIAAIDAAGALGPPKKELAVAKWAGRVVAAGVIAVCGAWQFGYL